MKRIPSIAAIGLSALLVGCGGDSTSTALPPDVPTSNPEPVAPKAGVKTAAPTQLAPPKQSD